MTPDMVGAGEIEITRAQNRNLGIAEGFRRMTRQSDSWSLMLRYQAQAERMYRRAIEDFDRLKVLRDEMPNEPNDLFQPAQTDEVIPLEELNPDLKTWRETDEPAPAPPQPSRAPRADVELSVSALTKDGPVVISGPPVRKVTPPAPKVCEDATVRPYPHNRPIPVNAPGRPNEPNSPEIAPLRPSAPASPDANPTGNLSQ
jgi:hypothetical protein